MEFEQLHEERNTGANSMSPYVFDRLDEIESANAGPGDLSVEAGELMEEFAKGADELALLIERYGGSSTPPIAQSLSFVLAKSAKQPTPAMAGLVLAFLSRFRCKGQAEAVMNTLTAVQHFLHYCPIEGSGQPGYRSLFAFVKDCLEYDGRHCIIIKGHALAVLSIAHSRGIVENIFDSHEIAALRDRMHRLRMSEGEELREELSALEDL